MARPNYTQVRNIFDDANIPECSIPSTSSAVSIHTDFSKLSMQENIVEPNTENKWLADGTLNDDLQNLLQTEERLSPSCELSSQYTVISSNLGRSTDGSTKVSNVTPSMSIDSLIRVGLECEIPKGILQLRSPIAHTSQSMHQNKIIMDMRKPNRSVMLEPIVFEDIVLKNPIESTDNTAQFGSAPATMDSPVCVSQDYESTDDDIQLHSPIVHASDCTYENKVIMDICKRNMSVTSDPRIFVGNPVLPSTGPSNFGPIILQNTLERTDNLLEKSFNVNYNSFDHFQTRGYEKNSLLTNTDASHIRLPLAGTGYLNENNFVSINRNQSCMPNPDLRGYQGNSFLMSTEQLIPQHSVSSSAAGPLKGTHGSFVDMDILNMSFVAGPSGYGINSDVVSNDSESPVRAAKSQSKYMCPFCEYETNRKLDMVRHTRVHTGERPFQCSDCHNTFRRKSHLVEHIRIHTGEKPFNCDVCEFSCSRKIELNRHKQKMHTCERAFKPDICKNIP